MAVKTKKTKKTSTPKSKSLVEVNDFNEVNESYVAPKKNFKTLKLLLVLIVLGALLYFGKSLLFAAVVNGRPISRIALIKSLEKQSGKQTLDSLVNSQLIEQEASKKNIKVTDEEIQKEIQRLTSVVEAQGMNLDQALEYQGQTREQLEKNIKLQKEVEQILKNEIAINDEEVKKYYEENKATYGKDAKIEDLQDQIKEQLTQQKLTAEFSKWIENVKKDANIMYFINFSGK